MKKTISILAFSLSLLWFTPAVAETYVNGYTKSNGTYVQGHYRSSPNSSRWDNYSSKGNSNPYTGKKGYKKDNSIYGGYSNKRKSYRKY